MKKRKFYPHPYVEQVIPDFRTDIEEWRVKHGLTEHEANNALGRHRMFYHHQRHGTNEPRISTILECYARMREYEQERKAK